MATETSGRLQVLLVLFLGVLIVALDIAMVGPALPAIRDAYNIDERSASWVLTVFVLFNLVGVPLMAKLADHRGRRFVFTLDLAIFTAGAIVVSSAPPFGVLLAGRALQGIGAAGIFPVASAVVGDTFPKELQGRALGVLGSVFGVAFIIGPATSGILLNFGWQWLFLVPIPLALLAATRGRKFMPAVGGGVPLAKFDVRGLVLLSVALAALAVGINGLDADGFFRSLSKPRVWGLSLVAAIFVGALIVSTRKAPNPILSPAIFRSRQARLALLLTVATGFCEAVIIFVPALAEVTFSVTKSTASFMFLPLAVAVALGSPAFGAVLDRFGSRIAVFLSSGSLSAGLWMMALLESRIAFYAGSVLVGLALAGLLGSALNYILLREAPAEDRVAAQGIITLSLNTGLLVGGAAVGALASSGVTRRAGYESAFETIAVVGIMMILVSLFLRRAGSATGADS